MKIVQNKILGSGQYSDLFYSNRIFMHKQLKIFAETIFIIGKMLYMTQQFWLNEFKVRLIEIMDEDKL